MTTASAAASQTGAPSRPNLPYLVSRTPSNNLPVYDESKAAGSKKLTLIRKIQGDHKALMADLNAGLAIPPEDMTINPVTRHIVIKVRFGAFSHPHLREVVASTSWWSASDFLQGRHTQAIKDWLAKQGF